MMLDRGNIYPSSPYTGIGDILLDFDISFSTPGLKTSNATSLCVMEL